jgi:hypothetical protein
LSETPENIALEHLRIIRAGMGDLGRKIDELKADMVEVKERLGFLEAQYASISRAWTGWAAISNSSSAASN